MASNPSPIIEIFLCYAREDEELRQSLEKQLRALKRQGLIKEMCKIRSHFSQLFGVAA